MCVSVCRRAQTLETRQETWLLSWFEKRWASSSTGPSLSSRTFIDQTCNGNHTHQATQECATVRRGWQLNMHESPTTNFQCPHMREEAPLSRIAVLAGKKERRGWSNAFDFLNGALPIESTGCRRPQSQTPRIACQVKSDHRFALGNGSQGIQVASSINIRCQDSVVLRDIEHGVLEPLMRCVFIDRLQLTVWLDRIICLRVVAIRFLRARARRSLQIFIFDTAVVVPVLSTTRLHVGLPTERGLWGVHHVLELHVAAIGTHDQRCFSVIQTESSLNQPKMHRFRIMCSSPFFAVSLKHAMMARSSDVRRPYTDSHTTDECAWND